MCEGWRSVSGLQRVQVEDFISPDVRNELRDKRKSIGGMLTLRSVFDCRDRRRAPSGGQKNKTKHEKALYISYVLV